MRSRAVDRAVPGPVSIDDRGDVGPQPDILALNSLAVRSLVLLFDQKEKLFCQRLVLTAEGLRREGLSPKRTMIALLGLERLRESRGRHPFDLPSIRDVVLRDRSWVQNAGDIGLLIWFAAASDPEQLPALLNDFDLEKVVQACSNDCELSTRSLAWLLAGIAHARLGSCGKIPDLTDAAVEIFHILQENQSESGFLGALGNGPVFWERWLAGVWEHFLIKFMRSMPFRLSAGPSISRSPWGRLWTAQTRSARSKEKWGNGGSSMTGALVAS